MQIRETIQLVLRDFFSLFVAIVAVMIPLSLSFGLVDQAGKGQFVHKAPLQQRLEKAIQQGADLRAVRQIFASRDRKTFIPLPFFSAKSEQIYREPLSLATVLEDLRADAFEREPTDPGLVKKIDPLIREHDQTDPFEKLAPSQRVDFGYLRSQLGENYAPVQETVERIVEQLATQNRIVADYLGDAKFSLYLAAVALIVSIIALVPPISQFRSWLRERVGRGPSAAKPGASGNAPQAGAPEARR